METLRIYLNTMFQSLPDTAEVQRARDELWQMMEDKYTDLISEGVSENEALGTVISEFGNLDDFADLLGIRSLVPYGRPGENSDSDAQGGNGQESSESRYAGSWEAGENQSAGRKKSGRGKYAGDGSPKYGYTAKPCRILTVGETGAYLEEMTKISIIRAIGVFLCITCVIGHVFFGDIGDHMGLFGGVFRVTGNIVFWGFIVTGVLFFIWSGQLDDRWKYIRKERCILDPEAQLLVTDRYNGVQTGVKRFRTVGILLCAFCWLPVAILSGFDFSFFTDNLGPTMLFLLVGTGVGILVISSGIEDAHKKLLKRDQKLKAEGQVLQ